jgi:Raf kinase inhibitor-like YbhB/YbcL family protein
MRVEYLAFCMGLSMASLGMVSLAAGPAWAAPFSVSSSSVRDGGMLAKKYAADPMRMCGGENVSPALAWANPPKATKSFAIFMFDSDGRMGLSVSHWVAYGIPAKVMSLAEGEAAKESTKFIGGKGTRGNALYIGPCPPMGDAPHHYLFTVVATDLDPHALKPEMTRDEVYAALAGHALAGASIVGKFAR